MTTPNDELSSHRTRTNRRPADLPVTTSSTAVLDAPEAQPTSDR